MALDPVVSRRVLAVFACGLLGGCVFVPTAEQLAAQRGGHEAAAVLPDAAAPRLPSLQTRHFDVDNDADELLGEIQVMFAAYENTFVTIAREYNLGYEELRNANPGVDVWLHDVLTNLPGGKIGFLIVLNLLVFGLGFFIDFFEICFIIVPLIAAPAQALGIDLTWLGVLLAVNMQTSFLTPPFGFALFYLRGVAPPAIRTADIYRGAIPFVAIQVVGLLLVIVFPQLVTALGR
jgi:hypothetical protein